MRTRDGWALSASALGTAYARNNPTDVLVVSAGVQVPFGRGTRDAP